MSSETQAGSHSAQPKLKRAGAGLPWPEKWLVRWMVPRMAHKATWQQADEMFVSQSAKILKDVHGLDKARLSTPFLIKRIRGLEDSSRFWSVAMTLEHSAIVTEGMAEITIKLSRGEKLDFVVDVVKVKPQKAWAPEKSIELFNEMVIRVQKRFATEVKDKNSKTTHFHPWFGELDCHQWHWLAASHLTIHKTQIREIIKGLH